MKNYKTRFVAVQEETAEAFMKSMNEVLDEAIDPEITYPSIPFVAYISYKTEEEVCMTAEDEYFAKVGKYACCGDCEYLERSLDGRAKRHNCRFSKFQRYMDSRACDLYYEKFLKGEL